MTLEPPRCPMHPEYASRSAAKFGRRAWLCSRCGRDLGDAPLSSAYEWAGWVAELGEEAAKAKALGSYRGPLVPGPASKTAEEEEQEEKEPVASAPTPAPAPAPVLAAPAARRSPPVRSEPAPTPAMPATPPPSELPRIVLRHQPTCKKEPCTCAAKLRTFSTIAHQLAATTLEAAADFSTIHEADREALRGHLQRIVIRLRKGPVC